MGVDIHVTLLARTKTNKWREINLYNKVGRPIPLYEGRDSELFDILSDNFDKGLFNTEYYPNTLLDEIEVYKNNGYDFHELNLADFIIFINKEKDKRTRKILKKFKNIILSYITFCEELFYVNYSDIIIVYWFDN